MAANSTKKIDTDKVEERDLGCVYGWKNVMLTRVWVEFNIVLRGWTLGEGLFF